MAVEIDKYSEANASTETNLYAAVGATRGKGQSFTCGGDYELDSVKFYGRKYGTGAGTAYAKIYSHSGTYGTSSVPGTLLATSDGVDTSGWSTTSGLREFVFSGAERIALSSGYYVVTVEVAGGSSSNFIRISSDTSSPAHDGNAINQAYNEAWTAVGTADTCFYVYGLESAVEQICSESITIASNVFKTPGVVKVESITLVAVAVKGFSRVWSETVSLGALLAKAPGKVLAEALSLVDTFSKLLTKGKELLETITLVDTVNKGITRLFTQAVAIGGAVVKAASKTFSEVLSVGEVLEKFKAAIKDLTETISVTDTLTKAANKVLSETVTLVDSITRAITKVYSETVTLVETLIKQSFLYKVFTETITLTDSITSAISKMWVKVSKPTTTFSKQTKPTSAWTKQSKATTSFTKTGR